MIFRKQTVRRKTLLQKSFPPENLLSENSYMIAAQFTEDWYSDSQVSVPLAFGRARR
jgi:hypothetical protein